MEGVKMIETNDYGFNKTEIWKDVKDFEGLYQISSFGRVKSLERITKDYMHTNGVHKKERILMQKTSAAGYKIVCLSKKHKNYHLLVHRMVAQAFVPNPRNLPVVNHKDENKQNNNVQNIEWCSHKYNLSYNNLHLRRIKKTKKTNTERYGKKIIIEKTGERFESIHEMCRQKNLDRRTVMRTILKGKGLYKIIEE